MLVCSECTNPDACTCHETETRAIFCSPPDKQKVIRCEWREYIEGDERYNDPMEKPYYGTKAVFFPPKS